MKTMKKMKFLIMSLALSLSMSAMCHTATQMKSKTVLKEKSSKKAKSKGLVEFALYGTYMQVRFDASKRVKVKNGDNNKVADCIEWINSITDETLQDCLKLKKELNLCDWAYVKMLDKLSSASLGKTNEAVVMMAVLLNKSGYDTRLGWDQSHKQLKMLFTSDANIYGGSFVNVNNKNYFYYGEADSCKMILGPEMPQGKPVSMRIYGEQKFAEKLSAPRTLTSAKNPDFSFTVQVNKNLVDFYGEMPSFVYDNNFMTRWAYIANLPLEKRLQETLILQMKQKLAGKSQLEKVQELLWWVQQAFVYEYDDSVWGHDRAFYAEETLFYPCSDTEDRSILLSRLVRDVVGLDVLFVYYPGHTAIAICFTDAAIEGAYVVYQGRHFVVCDPTYIGASVGEEIPGIDVEKKTVMLLER